MGPSTIIFLSNVVFIIKLRLIRHKSEQHIKGKQVYFAMIKNAENEQHVLMGVTENGTKSTSGHSNKKKPEMNSTDAGTRDNVDSGLEKTSGTLERLVAYEPPQIYHLEVTDYQTSEEKPRKIKSKQQSINHFLFAAALLFPKENKRKNLLN